MVPLTESVSLNDELTPSQEIMGQTEKNNIRFRFFKEFYSFVPVCLCDSGLLLFVHILTADGTVHGIHVANSRNM
jgi:hypothetical protein